MTPTCPSTWYGGSPERAARFPSADAALAALEAVFGEGSPYRLPAPRDPGRPVRVMPVRS